MAKSFNSHDIKKEVVGWFSDPKLRLKNSPTSPFNLEIYEKANSQEEFKHISELVEKEWELIAADLKRDARFQEIGDELLKSSLKVIVYWQFAKIVDEDDRITSFNELGNQYVNKDKSADNAEHDEEIQQDFKIAIEQTVQSALYQAQQASIGAAFTEEIQKSIPERLLTLQDIKQVEELLFDADYLWDTYLKVRERKEHHEFIERHRKEYIEKIVEDKWSEIKQTQGIKELVENQKLNHQLDYGELFKLVLHKQTGTDLSLSELLEVYPHTGADFYETNSLHVDWIWAQECDKSVLDSVKPSLQKHFFYKHLFFSYFTLTKDLLFYLSDGYGYFLPKSSFQTLSEQRDCVKVSYRESYSPPTTDRSFAFEKYQYDLRNQLIEIMKNILERQTTFIDEKEAIEKITRNGGYLYEEDLSPIAKKRDFIKQYINVVKNVSGGWGGARDYWSDQSRQYFWSINEMDEIVKILSYLIFQDKADRRLDSFSTILYYAARKGWYDKHSQFKGEDEAFSGIKLIAKGSPIHEMVMGREKLVFEEAIFSNAAQAEAAKSISYRAAKAKFEESTRKNFEVGVAKAEFEEAEFNFKFWEERHNLFEKLKTTQVDTDGNELDEIDKQIEELKKSLSKSKSENLNKVLKDALVFEKNFTNSKHSYTQYNELAKKMEEECSKIGGRKAKDTAKAIKKIASKFIDIEKELLEILKTKREVIDGNALEGHPNKDIAVAHIKDKVLIGLNKNSSIKYIDRASKLLSKNILKFYLESLRSANKGEVENLVKTNEDKFENSKVKDIQSRYIILKLSKLLGYDFGSERSGKCGDKIPDTLDDHLEKFTDYILHSNKGIKLLIDAASESNSEIILGGSKDLDPDFTDHAERCVIEYIFSHHDLIKDLTEANEKKTVNVYIGNNKLACIFCAAVFNSLNADYLENLVFGYRGNHGEIPTSKSFESASNHDSLNANFLNSKTFKHAESCTRKKELGDLIVQNIRVLEKIQHSNAINSHVSPERGVKGKFGLKHHIEEVINSKMLEIKDIRDNKGKESANFLKWCNQTIDKLKNILKKVENIGIYELLSSLLEDETAKLERVKDCAMEKEISITDSNDNLETDIAANPNPYNQGGNLSYSYEKDYIDKIGNQIIRQLNEGRKVEELGAQLKWLGILETDNLPDINEVEKCVGILHTSGEEGEKWVAVAILGSATDEGKSEMLSSEDISSAFVVDENLIQLRDLSKNQKDTDEETIYTGKNTFSPEIMALCYVEKIAERITDNRANEIIINQLDDESALREYFHQVYLDHEVDGQLEHLLGLGDDIIDQFKQGVKIEKAKKNKKGKKSKKKIEGRDKVLISEKLNEDLSKKTSAFVDLLVKYKIDLFNLSEPDDQYDAMEEGEGESETESEGENLYKTYENLLWNKFPIESTEDAKIGFYRTFKAELEGKAGLESKLQRIKTDSPTRRKIELILEADIRKEIEGKLLAPVPQIDIFERDNVGHPEARSNAYTNQADILYKYTDDDVRRVWNKIKRDYEGESLSFANVAIGNIRDSEDDTVKLFPDADGLNNPFIGVYCTSEYTEYGVKTNKNDIDGHWIAFAIVKKEDKVTVLYKDSLNGKKIDEKLLNLLKKKYGDDTELIPHEVDEQCRDTTSCGVFAVNNAKKLADFIKSSDLDNVVEFKNKKDFTKLSEVEGLRKSYGEYYKEELFVEIKRGYENAKFRSEIRKSLSKNDEVSNVVGVLKNHPSLASSNVDIIDADKNFNKESSQEVGVEVFILEQDEDLMNRTEEIHYGLRLYFSNDTPNLDVSSVLFGQLTKHKDFYESSSNAVKEYILSNAKNAVSDHVRHRNIDTKIKKELEDELGTRKPVIQANQSQYLGEPNESSDIENEMIKAAVQNSLETWQKEIQQNDTELNGGIFNHLGGMLDSEIEANLAQTNKGAGSSRLSTEVESKILNQNNVHQTVALWQAAQSANKSFLASVTVTNAASTKHAVALQVKRISHELSDGGTQQHTASLEIKIIDPLSREDSEFKEVLGELKSNISSSLSPYGHVATQIVYAGVQDCRYGTCGDMSLIILKALSEGKSLDKFISSYKKTMAIASDPHDISEQSDQSQISTNDIYIEKLNAQIQHAASGGQTFETLQNHLTSRVESLEAQAPVSSSTVRYVESKDTSHQLLNPLQIANLHPLRDIHAESTASAHNSVQSAAVANPVNNLYQSQPATSMYNTRAIDYNSNPHVDAIVPFARQQEFSRSAPGYHSNPGIRTIGYSVTDRGYDHYGEYKAQVSGENFISGLLLNTANYLIKAGVVDKNVDVLSQKFISYKNDFLSLVQQSGDIKIKDGVVVNGDEFLKNYNRHLEEYLYSKRSFSEKVAINVEAGISGIVSCAEKGSSAVIVAHEAGNLASLIQKEWNGEQLSIYEKISGVASEVKIYNAVSSLYNGGSVYTFGLGVDTIADCISFGYSASQEDHPKFIAARSKFLTSLNYSVSTSISHSAAMSVTTALGVPLLGKIAIVAHGTSYATGLLKSYTHSWIGEGGYTDYCVTGLDNIAKTAAEPVIFATDTIAIPFASVMGEIGWLDEDTKFQNHIRALEINKTLNDYSSDWIPKWIYNFEQDSGWYQNKIDKANELEGYKKHFAKSNDQKLYDGIYKLAIEKKCDLINSGKSAEDAKEWMELKLKANVVIKAPEVGDYSEDSQRYVYKYDICFEMNSFGEGDEQAKLYHCYSKSNNSVDSVSVSSTSPYESPVVMDGYVERTNIHFEM